MKQRSVLFWIAVGYGILVTLFIAMVFGPKIAGLFIEKGISYIHEIAWSFVHWYDNPTAFFFMYIIGYGLVWWKQLAGSAIIALGGLLFLCFNPSNIMFLMIFILPTLLVSVLYTALWRLERRP